MQGMALGWNYFFQVSRTPPKSLEQACTSSSRSGELERTQTREGAWFKPRLSCSSPSTLFHSGSLLSLSRSPLLVSLVSFVAASKPLPHG